MAKRFTDTEKWKKEFIKGLKPKYKLLWFYILDDCNHAGIWEVDLKIAGMRIGARLNYEEAFIALGKQIQPIGKTRWFIKDFIQFQYGELSPKNNLHKSVMSLLKQFNINQNEPLMSPSGGAKDMDKEKDRVKDKEIGGVGDFKPLSDDWFTNIFDEGYLEAIAMTYRGIDIPDQLAKFKVKVCGSPDEYQHRDTGSIRNAFQYKLDGIKPSTNGQPKKELTLDELKAQY